MASNPLPTTVPGDKVKKALALVSEKLAENPDADRRKLLNDAIIRYDLTPKESEFLSRNFSGDKEK